MAADFHGFDPDWAAFFTELKVNNDKAFWEANKQRYLQRVRAPMEALAGALEGVFGPPHFYRPYRDLRFSHDKRPYKVHVAFSFGGRGPSAIGGRYVHLDLSGLFVGGGAYQLPPAALPVYRRAVADEVVGPELARVVEVLAAAGYAIEGEQLKRVPNGFPADHPRAELLRRKGLYASKHFPPADWFHTDAVFDEVARALGDVEPLVAWFRRHCYQAE